MHNAFLTQSKSTPCLVCPNWEKCQVLLQNKVVESLINQLLGDVQPFLEQHDDLGQATRSRMLCILQDPSKKMYLKVEMAAVVDAGKQFVETTYKLEGNGPLVLYCYEYIEASAHDIPVGHFPNTDAVIRECSVGQPGHLAPHLQVYAKSCVQPGFDYFFSQFHGELGDTLAAFKAAGLFLPHKVCELQVDASSVDSLTAFPFLRNETLLSGMKSELPTYLRSKCFWCCCR